MDQTISINVEVLFTLITTFVASAGFWSFLQHRFSRRSDENKLLLILAGYVIITQAQSYIDRGFISPSEYRELHDMLYYRYKELGGNSSVDSLMKRVEQLPATLKGD